MCLRGWSGRAVASSAVSADAVARSLTGEMTSRVPGSLLQSVPGKVTWFVDADAARQLL